MGGASDSLFECHYPGHIHFKAPTAVARGGRLRSRLFFAAHRQRIEALTEPTKHQGCMYWPSDYLQKEHP